MEFKMPLKQESSEESDLRDLPRKEVTENSVFDKVSKKPRKGSWIVMLEKLVKCNQCNIFLLNHEQFLRHQHEKCVETNDQKLTETHKNTIGNEIEEENKCSVCDKTFNTKWGLRKHFKYIHTEFKVDCKKCVKSFKSHSNLDTHMKSVHSGMKFECTSCN